MAPEITADAIALEAANKACKDEVRKVEEAKHVVMTAGAKAFKKNADFLTDEVRQPWEMILKAQVMQAPWEDVAY